MIQVKKTSIVAFIIISTVFLIASTSAIAEYSQTQNKVDDKQSSSEQSQPNTTYEKKSDEDKSERSFSDESDCDINKPDCNMNEPAEMEKRTSPETERRGGY